MSAVTTLEFGTLAGVKDGEKIRYAGRDTSEGKRVVVTVKRMGKRIALLDSKGNVAEFGSSSKVWHGSVTVNAIPAQRVAPKPKATPKAKPAPKAKASTKAVVTSVTGLSVEQLSARAIKAAASRAARKADPSFVPPSQRGSNLPESHPHRIRARKAAESRQRAIADPSYVPPSRLPRSADRHEAAVNAWATRRANMAAEQAADAKAARKAKADARKAAKAA